MLYSRIVKIGTISEPDGKPDPQFALPSAVNWMKGLRILSEANSVDFDNAKKFYANEGKRAMSPLVENTILEQLFLSLHHLSALEKMAENSADGDLGRIAVLAWYYGISNAASAMVAARHGLFQEDHSSTARMWDSEIAGSGLAMPPFHYRVTSLIEPIFRPEIDAYKTAASGGLLNDPSSVSDAVGTVAGYLSGSAKWYAWKASEDVRRTAAFKDLMVDNFRSKPARQLRDARLASRSVGFLHQASRYRGKANYREALFLAYGSSTSTLLSGYTENQAIVLRAFLAMAGGYAARKLGKAIWAEFIADVDSNRAFSTSASSVWT